MTVLSSLICEQEKKRERGGGWVPRKNARRREGEGKRGEDAKFTPDISAVSQCARCIQAHNVLDTPQQTRCYRTHNTNSNPPKFDVVLSAEIKKIKIKKKLLQLINNRTKQFSNKADIKLLVGLTGSWANIWRSSLLSPSKRYSSHLRQFADKKLNVGRSCRSNMGVPPLY